MLVVVYMRLLIVIWICSTENMMGAECSRDGVGLGSYFPKTFPGMKMKQNAAKIMGWILVCFSVVFAVHPALLPASSLLWPTGVS